MNIKELPQAFECQKIFGEGSGKITGVSIDSRTIKPGELFFAIQGDRFDGHDFIEAAMLKGAQGVVFSLPSSSPVSPGFLVRDTVRALQDLAHYYRQKMPAKIVGVTGSNGKTTTKDWIAHLCTKNWLTLKTEGTLNNHLGVPLTLLKLKEAHQVGVIEMGMSGLGEIERLAFLAQPAIGVVTNIAPAHVEFLGSLENIYKAKLELVRSLQGPEDIAVLNIEDPWVFKMYAEAKCRIVTFGASGDYSAENIACRECVQFDLKVGQKRYPIKLKVMGEHNVMNCLAAIAVCHQLGASIEMLASACSELELPAMRLEKRVEKGVLFINDAYNANPKSMEVALDTLNELETEGKKIFVCGDMMELGLYADEAHSQLGEKIYNSEVDVLITYGHLAQRTAQKAIEIGMEQDNVFVCTERNMIADLLQSVALPGDVVLLKGSRRNHLERILVDWRAKADV